MKQYITKIKYDKNLADKMDVFCDFFLDDQILDNNSVWEGVTFSVPGQAFGHDGSGGEYMLLEDMTVGFCSFDGECGRIAENITDFFTLITNCYYYCEFLYPELIDDAKKLKEYFRDWEETSRNSIKTDQVYDYDQVRRDIGKALDIPVGEEIALQSLQRLYHCLTIKPPFIAYFLEKNGEQSPSRLLIEEGDSCETEYSQESVDEDMIDVPEQEADDMVTIYMEGATWS